MLNGCLNWQKLSSAGKCTRICIFRYTVLDVEVAIIRIRNNVREKRLVWPWEQPFIKWDKPRRLGNTILTHRIIQTIDHTVSYAFSAPGSHLALSKGATDRRKERFMSHKLQSSLITFRTLTRNWTIPCWWLTFAHRALRPKTTRSWQDAVDSKSALLIRCPIIHRLLTSVLWYCCCGRIRAHETDSATL